jgi:hypothetical protein
MELNSKGLKKQDKAIKKKYIGGIKQFRILANYCSNY